MESGYAKDICRQRQRRIEPGHRIRYSANILFGLVPRFAGTLTTHAGGEDKKDQQIAEAPGNAKM